MEGFWEMVRVRYKVVVCFNLFIFVKKKMITWDQLSMYVVTGSCWHSDQTTTTTTLAEQQSSQSKSIRQSNNDLY